MWDMLGACPTLDALAFGNIAVYPGALCFANITELIHLGEPAFLRVDLRHPERHLKGNGHQPRQTLAGSPLRLLLLRERRSRKFC